jgi:uncharacterized SAM-binding protein YcdF (DUF218 family)
VHKPHCSKTIGSSNFITIGVVSLYELFQKILKVFIILFLLWIGGLGIYVFSIPQHVIDDHTQTEVIVVLTGGRERLKTGFQLLCSHRAKMIFISGVNPEETFKTLLKTIDIQGINCPLDRDQLVSSTHLGYTAKNTKENAEETAAWVKQMGITSLRLVTAAYHMPRSLMELRYLLPQTTIIPHPVFPYGPTRFRWLLNEGALHLVFSEYNKFLWGLARRVIPY